LKKGELRAPTIFVGNYLLDSLTTDFFRVFTPKSIYVTVVRILLTSVYVYLCVHVFIYIYIYIYIYVCMYVYLPIVCVSRTSTRRFN